MFPSHEAKKVDCGKDTSMNPPTMERQQGEEEEEEEEEEDVSFIPQWMQPEKKKEKKKEEYISIFPSPVQLRDVEEMKDEEQEDVSILSSWIKREKKKDEGVSIFSSYQHLRDEEEEKKEENESISFLCVKSNKKRQRQEEKRSASSPWYLRPADEEGPEEDDEEEEEDLTLSFWRMKQEQEEQEEVRRNFGGVADGDMEEGGGYSAQQHDEVLDIVDLLRNPVTRPPEDQAVVAALLAGYHAHIDFMRNGIETPGVMDAVLAICGDCWERSRFRGAEDFITQLVPGHEDANDEEVLHKLLAGIGIIWRSVVANGVPPRAELTLHASAADAIFGAAESLMERVGSNCTELSLDMNMWMTWDVTKMMTLVSYLQAVDLQLRLVPGMDESERFPEENRASLHVTREHLDQLVQCIVGNVKSKLGQGFIDNLLLTQMQLLASLIRHCDTVSRTDAGRRRDRKTRTNVSVFTSAARQELCSDICPRLLNLINRALGARIKDVEVRLAEAEMLNTGTGHSVNGDFQFNHERPSKRVRRSRRSDPTHVDQAKGFEEFAKYSSIQLEFQYAACNVLQSFLLSTEGGTNWSRIDPSTFFGPIIKAVGSLRVEAAKRDCEDQLWIMVSFFLPVARLIAVVKGFADTRRILEELLGEMDDAAILNVVLDHVGRVMLLMRSEVPEAFDLNAVRYRTARPLKSRVDKGILAGMKRRNVRNKTYNTANKKELGSLAGPMNTLLNAAEAGPLEINVMDTLDVSQDVLLSMVLMTKRKDDITKANKKRRGMLLMVGSSLPPCVMSLLQECSQCVMFYQTRGMKLTQSSQVVIVLVIGILIDLGHARDLPHLLTSRFGILAGKSACEGFLDSACRVFRYVQEFTGFSHPLELVLCENGEIKVYVSPFIHLKEFYEDKDNTMFLQRLFQLHANQTIDSLKMIDIENTMDCHRSSTRLNQNAANLLLTAAASPPLLTLAESGMGRYAGSYQYHQVNLLSPPVPEAADGQLTAAVALSVRSFLAPTGVGGRSIELRTQDRFGEDLRSAIRSLSLGPEAQKPSILARAAISAAVKRQAKPEADIMLYPARLSALAVNSVRLISSTKNKDI